MSNLKWADVAHYYQKASLDVVIQEDGSEILAYEAIFAPSGRAIAKQHRGDGRIDCPINAEIDQYRPILRALEDMTEGEARGLYKAIWIDLMEWDENSVGPMHGSCLKNWWNRESISTPEKRTWGDDMIGNPIAWSWLISKGFDVFGLIESNQAIRKGVES